MVFSSISITCTHTHTIWNFDDNKKVLRYFLLTAMGTLVLFNLQLNNMQSNVLTRKFNATLNNFVLNSGKVYQRKTKQLVIHSGAVLWWNSIMINLSGIQKPSLAQWIRTVGLILAIIKICKLLSVHWMRSKWMLIVPTHYSQFNPIPSKNSLTLIKIHDDYSKMPTIVISICT